MNLPSVLSALIIGALLLALQPAHAANPVVTNLYTADPTIRYFDGKYWLYTTHDESSAKSLVTFDMRDWRAYSSTDLKTWTDHGAIMRIEDIAWATDDAWAVDVVYRNGLYYMFFPVDKKYIGVATSTSPAGPFRDAIGGPLVTSDMPNAPGMTIDPAVLIDDDGQAYLYFGNDDPLAAISMLPAGKPQNARNVPRMVKLKPSLLALDGPIMDVPGVTNFFEAAWIHKHNGTYYLSYAANGGFSDISYATASSPTGPFTMRGVVNDRLLDPSSVTNHHSIIDGPDGNSYLAYHTTELSDGQWYRRSAATDRLHYNADGSIRTVKRTWMGTDDTLRTNCGEETAGNMVSASNGNAWYWDRGFGSDTHVLRTSAPIAGTANPLVYQVQRYSEGLFWSQTPLRYAFPVENGNYSVTLLFAETYFTGNGRRVFDINLEGARAYSRLDIHAEAGGGNRALNKTFSTTVADGTLNLDLLPVTNNPQIAGIVLKRLP